MAVDLQTWDTLLPYLYLPDKQAEHIIPLSSHYHTNSNIHVNGSSPLNSHHVLAPPHFATPPLQAYSTEEQPQEEKHEDIDHMSYFFMQLQDQDRHEFHCYGNLEPSPLGSNQGSREGFCESTNTVVGMFENMKLHERGNSKYQMGCGSTCFNIGPSTYQSFIHDQIRAIQLSRLKQEQVLSLKQKLGAYRESRTQISHQYESNEQMMRFHKKGKGVGVESGYGRRRTHPIRPGPLTQQTGSEMQPPFLDGSGSHGASCGTGVFLPRGGTSAPSKTPDKGCSNVLIPARVVQALQLQFDQMAATSGPKPAGFPPLHDVLVSNRDGMYSLQKRQSRKGMGNIQNEMILPQEWTY